MGAKHASVHVSLVDDDKGKLGQHATPSLVVGQHGGVQDVRVGQDDVGIVSDKGAVTKGSVTIECSVAHTHTHTHTASASVLRAMVVAVLLLAPYPGTTTCCKASEALMSLFSAPSWS